MLFGDPYTCLFGTLSLWQGLDVPGDTCQLVIIDRIPFPRPDDPLMSARQQAADRAGRNGFLSVAATHAALLLAQGTGRLIRTTTDRGVVAVLERPGDAPVHLVGSFHVSQQNTFTGRLTEAMLDDVLTTARRLAT